MRVLFVGSEISIKNSPEGIVSRALIDGFLQMGYAVDLVSPAFPPGLKVPGLERHFEFKPKVSFLVDKVIKKLTGLEGAGFHKYCCAVLQELAINEYDIIFIRSEPVSLHRLALFINDKYSVSCVCSFGDVGSVNPYYIRSLLGGLRKKNLERIERQVIDKGNVITQTSSRGVDLYKRAGFDVSNFIVLPNPIASSAKMSLSVPLSEDNHDVSVRECFKNVQRAAGQHKYNVAFIGSFYGDRKPDVMLKFLSNYSDVAVHVFGGVRNILYEKEGMFYSWMKNKGLSDLQSMAKSYGVSKFYVWPFMPIELLGVIIARHVDILINVDADFEPNPFLSSKLVQYLSYDKPVLNFSNEGATVDLLREAGVSYYVPYATESDVPNFAELMRLCKPTNSLADAYAPQQVVARLVGALGR